MKTKWLLALGTTWLSTGAWAAGYGIYDARTMALGGTGVALGSVNQGFYYNPALTAFHPTSENKGRDSRFYLPVVTAQVSGGALDAIDISEAELDQKLTDAIDNFNMATGQQQAAEALAITREIDADIDKLQDRNLSADIYAGTAISIPSEYQGGSVFLGSRLVGGGRANVLPADRELLQKYLAFFDYASSHDTVEDAPYADELYDTGSSSVGNPTNSIKSSALFRGAAISELGVSAAGLLTWQRADIAFGVTPKVVQTKIFDEVRQVVDEVVQSDADNKEHLYMNMDVGVAAEFSERLRVGFAMKDVITKRFISTKGNTIELAPRYRLGLSYQGDIFTAGVDADLKASPSFAGELGRQDISLGGELQLWQPVLLRAGYRHDLSGNMDGVITLGAGLRWWRLVVDAAYGFEPDQGQSGAVQLGVQF